jgi:hypothetical protein
MSTAVKAAASPVPVPIRRQRNTLQKLWRSVYLLWILDFALLITAVVVADVHRSAMQTIGKDSAPSIIHAQEIKYELADMDANAANELLGEKDTRTYEKRRTDAAKALILAARNITYDGEDKPINDIQTNLGTYEVQIQKARDLLERKDKDFLLAYRDAASTMDNQLLLNADALDDINDKELENAYESLSGRSGISNFVLLAVGVTFLSALVVVQKFLVQRMHRILNPGLLAATFVTVAFIGYTISVLDAESGHLKVAKKDAFDSIRALLRARAVAFAANGEESRYLLDSAHAHDHEVAFFNKASQLATVPESMTYEAVANSERNHQKVHGFEGLLATELRNITFESEGEGTNAVKTLKYFGDYMDIDKEIRRLEKSGKHDEAVKLCVGKSNDIFGLFNDALEATVKINQYAFDKNVREGLADLANFELKALAVAIVIALLVFFALQPRIREYR